ncbi:MAG: hypothetical protein IT371_21600 [Deltaproteobacteria bacterium]|nr:hypothetical protein [Deltaproteobacteria bacterium]
MGALCLAACGETPPSDVIDAELFPTTVLLGEDALASLRASEADGTLRFRGTPAALAGVADGRVLVGGVSEQSPAGLLRYVLSVEQDAEGMVLRTTEAPIQLAFRKLHVSFARQVGGPEAPVTFTADPAGPADGIGRRRAALSETIKGHFWPALPFKEFVFNGDEDPKTPLDQVMVTGQLSGGLDYTFTLDVDWGNVFGLPEAVQECVKKVAKLKLSLDCSLMNLLPEAKVGMSVTLGAKGHLGLEGVAFLGYEREITIAKSKLPQVVLGPLVLFPEVEVVAQITGAASSQFKVGLDAEIATTAKVSYSNKSGGSLTPPSIEKSFSAPSVEAALGAKAKLRLGPRLTVTLYSVAGIYAGLYAAAELAADQTKTPCWQLDGGVEGEVGFLIRSPELSPLLGHVTLAKFGKSFGVAKATVAQGTCKTPPSSGPTPTGGAPDNVAFANPTFTPWAAAYPDTVDGFPYEWPGAQVEWAQLTPTVDGRFLLSGSDAKVLLKLAPDGEVVWARRYVADVPFWRDLLIPDLLPGRVVTAADGGLFVVAHPYAVLKLDAAGKLAWARRFDVLYRETWLRFTDAITDGAGGLYVLGTHGTDYVNPLDTVTGWLLRLDGNGKLLWSRQLRSAQGGEIPRRLVGLGDEVVVVGDQWISQGAKWRGHVARFGSDGTLRWGTELVVDDCAGGSEKGLNLTTALRSRDGDLILGGGVFHAGNQAIVLKVKPDGALAWSSTAASADSAELGPVLLDLVELPTSGYLAAGQYSGKATRQDLWLAGLDAVGKVAWARAYGGAQNATDALRTSDSYPALHLTKDGGAIVGAYSEALIGLDTLWAMKVPAKDGTLAFNASTSASVRELPLVPGKACLTASAWQPLLGSLDQPWIPLAVKVLPAQVKTARIAP